MRHARGGGLAARLNALFERGVEWGGPYSNAQVAREIQANPERYGTTFSKQYLSQLRADRDGIRSPSLKVLRALATYFGVPVCYLLDDRCVLDPPETREAAVAVLIDRCADLSPGSFAAVTHLVDHLRRLEGLPEPAGPTNGMQSSSPSALRL